MTLDRELSVKRERTVLAHVHEVNVRRCFLRASVMSDVRDGTRRTVVRDLGDLVGRRGVRMDPGTDDIRHEYVGAVEHAVARMDALVCLEANRRTGTDDLFDLLAHRGCLAPSRPRHGPSGDS